ncbi:MAG: hypothetical protein ACYSR9_14990 [Planctomycetota bacterium]
MEDKDKGIRVWHFGGIRVEFGKVSGVMVLASRLWASESLIDGWTIMKVVFVYFDVTKGDSRLC